MNPRRLTRREREELALIERGLLDDYPTLARGLGRRRLTWFRVVLLLAAALGLAALVVGYPPGVLAAAVVAGVAWGRREWRSPRRRGPLP